MGRTIVPLLLDLAMHMNVSLSEPEYVCNFELMTLKCCTVVAASGADPLRLLVIFASNHIFGFVTLCRKQAKLLRVSCMLPLKNSRYSHAENEKPTLENCHSNALTPMQKIGLGRREDGGGDDDFEEDEDEDEDGMRITMTVAMTMTMGVAIAETAIMVMVLMMALVMMMMMMWAMATAIAVMMLMMMNIIMLVSFSHVSRGTVHLSQKAKDCHRFYY